MHSGMSLGAHVSIGGGYLNAIKEAQKAKMTAIQIFTKNQRSWKEKEIPVEEGLLFREAADKAGIVHRFSHSMYLISLGSSDAEIAEKSILALAMEIRRCEILGLQHTVLHPGHAGTLSKAAAIERIADGIKLALKLTSGSKVKIALENTAGQGSSIGGEIDHLARLIKKINSRRVGICIDTCHAFAAGYDLRTEKQCADFFKEVDHKIGCDLILNFHLNDSKGALCSHLDRHAHIGEGQLGLAVFRYLLHEFPTFPKVLETIKENNAEERNLKLLRSLIKH